MQWITSLFHLPALRCFHLRIGPVDPVGRLVGHRWRFKCNGSQTFFTFRPSEVFTVGSVRLIGNWLSYRVWFLQFGDRIFHCWRYNMQWITSLFHLPALRCCHLLIKAGPCFFSVFLMWCLGFRVYRLMLKV